MTKQLENLFDLPPAPEENPSKELLDQADSISKDITSVDEDKTDGEIDALATKAVNSYEELMSLGMNVEAKFSAPIFDAATKMLGHAITAKLGKAQKKLKEVELKMRAAKMGLDKNDNDTSEITASVIDRNELIKSLKNQ